MKVSRFALRAAALSMSLALIASGASVAFAGTVELPLTVVAAGKTFPVADAKVLDVNAFVNNTVAPSVNVAAVNATRKINAKARRVDFTAPRNGLALDRTTSVNLILAEIDHHKDDTITPAAQAVNLPTSAYAPKVTHFDKTIMSVLKRRRIYIYDNTKIVKTFPIAIGMPRYPTPTGTFIIARKVKNPSWTNPGGAWGKGMPSYIKPGPGNPLGTRALYLYRNGSDTGVRFHGTSNTGSIGHAASHGCMRMRRKDVEKLYNMIPVGTTVFVVK